MNSGLRLKTAVDNLFALLQQLSSSSQQKRTKEKYFTINRILQRLHLLPLQSMMLGVRVWEGINRKGLAEAILIRTIYDRLTSKVVLLKISSPTAFCSDRSRFEVAIALHW